MKFTVPIPHATITVEADSFAQAKARAYRAYADTAFAALSPADKLAAAALIAKRKSGI
jgi:hypothetical protein